MSCPGCLPTGKALAELYQQIKTQAKEYGKRNNIDIAIYQTPEGYSFIKSEIALSEGYNIKEIVSYTG
jgi:hypothetical protein